MATNVTRAILWDMDGVLVDSGDYHFEAWREALAREKHELDFEQFRSTFGQRNDTVLRSILGQDLSDSEIARIANYKEELYRKQVRDKGIDALPGVLHWLKQLHEAGWRQAVATAAPRENALTILDELLIEGFFGAIVSAEDVTRGKPDPQVYLTAAARLNAMPVRSIVIEDAPAGLEGARRAGMRCVGVRTSHDELEADIVVDLLTDLPANAFDKLLH